MRLYRDEILIKTDMDTNHRNGRFVCDVTMRVWVIETSLKWFAVQQLNELNYN